jgi:nicotinate-nucleotide pyrophosphorylase (carboxylating)
MKFSEPEARACRHLIELAFEEDLGAAGDITSKAVIPPKLEGLAVFVARAEGVVAGLPAAEMVFQTAHTPLMKFETLLEDDSRVKPGDRLATVSGLMEFILTGERIALNFLQHLSGVASLTRKYVDAIAGLPCKILDTRKTLPGWRVLQKYAVRCGGGDNHRMGLYDGILVKDNHLAALGKGARAFEALVRICGGAISLMDPEGKRLGEFFPALSHMEIEVEDLSDLRRALRCGTRIVLLDNMPPEQLREAVSLRNTFGPKTLLEASGGITLDNVRAVAETGVDRISIGALTHSAPALDVALDYER